MLVHCYAGISRSTAAAFIALCALNPHTPEELIASGLRSSSDTASPNRLFIALADKVLRRDGRMIAAVNGMGQSRVADECTPFAVSAHYEFEARTARSHADRSFSELGLPHLSKPPRRLQQSQL